MVHEMVNLQNRSFSTARGGWFPLNIGFTFTGRSSGEETYIFAGSGTHFFQSVVHFFQNSDGSLLVDFHQLNGLS
jgi:hypothetical protein